MAEALLSMGGSAVLEKEHRLITHLRESDAPADLERALRAHLGDPGEGEGWTVRARPVEDRDWRRTWKRGLGPRRVGDHWLVAPSWSPVPSGDGARVLRIDPGAAFGTGEHGTTRGMLRLLEGEVAPGDRVLDVGTGSGILAVAAARLGADRVVGIEQDLRALATARRNVGRNGVEDRVRLLAARVTPAFLRLLVPPPYDVLTANLSMASLVTLLPGLRAALAAEGRLLAGGVLDEERATVVRAARDAGLELVDDDRDEGWWSGRFEVGGDGQDGDLAFP
ncbi:MAG: 50S ribosomal protein L11 methyltransferase [Gemmatimonadota bacterium]